MTIRVTKDEQLKNEIRKRLKENGGYCPCVLNSRGKSEYKCMCNDFINNTPIGQSCHCGLYIKEKS